VIRDDEIVAALGAAESRGVEVRLIVDASMDEGTQGIAAVLHDWGGEIRLAETLYIPAKLMVIDGDQAVVGSQNFTPTSLDDNRELAIVVTDPFILARCAAIFERDWQRAIPGEPATTRT
jgi:phosphatidylserine/phosphatidylglycerophosphate/cardiolipin synthase-like enzyme